MSESKLKSEGFNVIMEKKIEEPNVIKEPNSIKINSQDNTKNENIIPVYEESEYNFGVRAVDFPKDKKCEIRTYIGEKRKLAKVQKERAFKIPKKSTKRTKKGFIEEYNSDFQATVLKSLEKMVGTLEKMFGSLENMQKMLSNIDSNVANIEKKAENLKIPEEPKAKEKIDDGFSP